MIIGIIQARMGSSRLPGKILMEFCGKSDLYHVYNRVGGSKKIDKIIIATTDGSDDDRVFQFCRENNIECFRGSQEDVLDRFYQCCLKYNITKGDTIVRITADCPLIDPNIIDEVIAFYIENNLDYASNALEPTYPDGLDVEVFSYLALKKSWKNAKLLSEREHVTPYIRNNQELFKIGSYKNNNMDLSQYRWTLDEKEDYEYINKIYINLYNNNRIFTMEEILAFLKQNPEINLINKKHTRNEGYLKSLKNDKKFESSEENE